jgi:hypothetical protein
MTNATFKALIDVYGILVKAGWGDAEDDDDERDEDADLDRLVFREINEPFLASGRRQPEPPEE